MGMNQQLRPNNPPIKNGGNIPQFNGAALVETSNDNNYGLVLNCKIFASNYKFTKGIEQQLIFVNNNMIDLNIIGTSVSWYSNDTNDFNGAQYIVPEESLNTLKLNISYLVYIMFTIDNKLYKQPLNPNGIKIPDGFNIESTISNNQLVIIRK